MNRTVTVSTAPVGSNFGVRGVVRDARTGRKLAQAETIRPHGFVTEARADAAAIAARKGWTVGGADE